MTAYAHEREEWLDATRDPRGWPPDETPTRAEAEHDDPPRDRRNR